MEDKFCFSRLYVKEGVSEKDWGWVRASVAVLTRRKVLNSRQDIVRTY